MTSIINHNGHDHTFAIDTDQLTKTYPGGVEAVKGISLAVPPGEVFGLLGPNGAGKSTTVGMLTTTITPTSGRARVAGFDVSSDPIAARRVSAVVFQEPVVDRPLTGRRNLLQARNKGLDSIRLPAWLPHCSGDHQQQNDGGQQPWKHGVGRVTQY